jgi:hypothetical protein
MQANDIEFFQARAKRLGFSIITVEPSDLDPDCYWGPYFLVCAITGRHLIHWSLPVEGLRDALRCFENELQLPPERAGEAWRNFLDDWPNQQGGVAA